MANIIKTPPNKKTKAKSAQAKRRRRNVVVAIACLLVAGLITWAAVAYINSQARQQAAEQSEEEKRLSALQTSSENVSEVYNQADSLIEAGDVDGVEALYDESLDAADSDIEKASLYFDRATSLHSMGSFDKALEAALEADRLDRGKQLVSRTESLIANTAYDLERWELALKYYERQYDRLKAEPADMGDPLPGLEERINDLKGRLGND